jgi:hypothetical protein
VLLAADQIAERGEYFRSCPIASRAVSLQRHQGW